MEHFKELVIRLQTLNLEIAPVNSPDSISTGYASTYSLAGENPHTNTELSLELETLKQKALLDIAILEGWQVFALLKKLYDIQVRYETFWERFHENIAEEDFGGWEEYYRSLMLDQLFLINSHGENSNYQFEAGFFIDLRESLEWREELLFEVIEEMESLITTDQQQGIEEHDQAEHNSRPVNSIPLFALAAQQDILNILADFFVPEDRGALQELILNRTSPPEKLLFNGSGNQLADAFKQLIEANLITSVSKRKLEQWITEHFQYQYKDTIRSFTARYLNGIISSESRLCQSPILDVKKKDDSLVVIPLLRNKKAKNR